jgi:hypothetical protein
MSKHETPMTRRYWKRVGGTLLEEYLVVPPRRPDVGRRLIDAVIVEDGEDRIASPGEAAGLSLDGHDIVIVQTKALRLGMYLLGQAFFSRELIRDRFTPRSVRTVALCAIDDAVLHPIAKRFGIEIVVDGLAATPGVDEVLLSTDET